MANGVARTTHAPTSNEGSKAIVAARSTIIVAKMIFMRDPKAREVASKRSAANSVTTINITTKALLHTEFHALSHALSLKGAVINPLNVSEKLSPPTHAPYVTIISGKNMAHAEIRKSRIPRPKNRGAMRGSSSSGSDEGIMIGSAPQINPAVKSFERRLRLS